VIDEKMVSSVAVAVFYLFSCWGFSYFFRFLIEMLVLDVLEDGGGDGFYGEMTLREGLAELGGGEGGQGVAVFLAFDACATDNEERREGDDLVEGVPRSGFVEDISADEQAEAMMGVSLLEVLEGVEGVIGRGEFCFDIQDTELGGEGSRAKLTHGDSIRKGSEILSKGMGCTGDHPDFIDFAAA
jgi:hypothetical protein